MGGALVGTAQEAISNELARAGLPWETLLRDLELLLSSGQVRTVDANSPSEREAGGNWTDRTLRSARRPLRPRAKHGGVRDPPRPSA